MLHSESSNYIAMYLFDEEIVFFTSCFIQLLLNLCESDHFIYIVNPPFQLGTAQPQSLASSLQLSFNVSKAFSRELKDSTHAQGLYKYVIYAATCLHQLQKFSLYPYIKFFLVPRNFVQSQSLISRPCLYIPSIFLPLLKIRKRRRI